MPAMSVLREAGRVVVLAWLAAACVVWTPAPPASAPRLLERGERDLRLTLSDSQRVRLDYARLRGDSLYGIGSDHKPRAIALADVRALTYPRHDVGKFVFVAGITALGLLVTAYLAALIILSGEET